MKSLIALAILASGTLDPCVAEKTIVTRKAAPKQSNAKPSPIIAWVTVRSGGPVNKDAPRCLDQEVVFDLPEPEFLSYDVTSEFTPLVYEEPIEPIYAEPSYRWPSWPPFYYWPTPRVRLPPSYSPPPSSDPPTDEPPPPPVAVPEPATSWLLLIGLLFAFALRRHRS